MAVGRWKWSWRPKSKDKEADGHFDITGAGEWEGKEEEKEWGIKSKREIHPEELECKGTERWGIRKTKGEIRGE